MSFVNQGFVGSASGSRRISYGANISGTWGFIGWNGTITDVTCEEYHNGSYYSSYTLISGKSCVDSRAVWGLYGGTFDFNYGAATSTVKLVMTMTTTVGTAVFTYEYQMVTNCEPPGSVTVSAESVAPNASVKLNWSKAKAGSYNAIKGYWIYRSTEYDGTYAKWQYIDATATSGSYTVKPPTENGASYYYKVQTIGTESGYDSEISIEYAELTCSYEAVSAPTVVTLSATNASPNAEVELSWSGASAGTNNPITGYEIYVSDRVNGDYGYPSTVMTSATYASARVRAPINNLESYVYRVKTLGTLDGSDSDLSTAYATLTCTYSMPSAPTKITVNDASSVYVLPGSTVTLKWSGASAGANNPIKGYSIYRDGVALVEGLATTVNSYEVTANAESGKSHSFTVVTLGEFADSAPSVARVVYSYTDPTAPTDITTKDDAPPAGTRVTLEWSGAAAGGYNDITGYRVYRSEEVNGSYTVIETVTTTETSGSCFVDAHPLVGMSYYFRVETIGSYSVSGPSEAYLQLTSVEAQAPDGDVTVVVKPVPRARRKMVFGEYDTDYDGPWTLCEWSLSEPEAQTNYVEVIGRMAGPLDLSTYLTGGDPRYGSRELAARFECSENTRLWREDLISLMTNKLHGQRVDITLPDDDTRYITGRLHVTKDYNDPAHASVSVSAVCSPWRYSRQETQVSVLAVETVQEFVLSNSGRRILVPTVTVSGYSASVVLTHGVHTWTLTTGEYRLPELVLRTGNTTLSCYGSGVISFTYREAVL